MNGEFKEMVLTERVRETRRRVVIVWKLFCGAETWGLRLAEGRGTNMLEVRCLVSATQMDSREVRGQI